MKGQTLHWTTIILATVIMLVVSYGVSYGASFNHKKNVEVLRLDIRDYQTQQELNQLLSTEMVYEDKLIKLADAFAIYAYDGSMRSEISDFLRQLYGSNDIYLFRSCKADYCELSISFGELTEDQIRNDKYFNTRNGEQDSNFRSNVVSELIGLDGKTIFIDMERDVLW